MTLIFGIGGMVMGNGDFTLQGISLCGLVAVILNQVLPDHTGTEEDLGEEHACKENWSEQRKDSY